MRGEHGVASSQIISDQDVGGVVKASGDRVGNRPPEYGANLHMGGQLAVFNFTVNHWETVLRMTPFVAEWMKQV